MSYQAKVDLIAAKERIAALEAEVASLTERNEALEEEMEDAIASAKICHDKLIKERPEDSFMLQVVIDTLAEALWGPEEKTNAEMIIDGDVCSGCGVPIDALPGFPQMCPGCAAAKAEEEKSG